jgi:hypothetical protein
MNHTILCFSLLLSSPAIAGEIIIEHPNQLRAALGKLKHGDHLKIGPGIYPGGHHLQGLNDLTIEALDPKQPPVFKGGKNAWQFSRCSGLTLRHLQITGQSDNGLNLDDDGQLDALVENITIEHVEVSDIGPQGNHDGIKCSGLKKLSIKNCRFKGWGGQGIDFVGCHDSQIIGCHFEGKPGFSASAGIQLKGGTSNILVENCHFINGGERPINAGGSTGLAYFRPQGLLHEAKDLIIRNNTFEGSPCAIAFVGVDGAEFSNNTVLFPRQWLFRILQETKAPGFAPCRHVIVKNNRFIFRRADLRTEVNIGPDTSSETFVFEGNHWFAEDQPQASRPKLPAPEKGGHYGKDPR